MGRAVFTVLLFSPVLRRDEFGLQWHDMGVSGRDDGCPEHGVEILGLTVAPEAFRALRAMDFVGTEILGAIKCDQRTVTKAVEGIQAARSFQFSQRGVEGR